MACRLQTCCPIIPLTHTVCRAWRWLDMRGSGSLRRGCFWTCELPSSLWDKVRKSHPVRCGISLEEDEKDWRWMMGSNGEAHLLDDELLFGGWDRLWWLAEG